MVPLNVEIRREVNSIDVNDWLPVTISRHAKWWYAAFHNVTAMVGAGVLTLPYAMSALGWGVGTVVMAMSWVITLYTLWQMVEMHEMVEGKRFDRYHELGQEAFGQKLGLWIVIPQQLIVNVGTNIAYMVTGGTSLQQFYRLVKCPHQDASQECGHLSVQAWVGIFASQHFLLAQLPNFNAIAGVSLTAAIMSVSYSTIAWTTAVHAAEKSSYHVPNIEDNTKAKSVFAAMKALGDIAFAYAGHNVVLEIQATIPSTKKMPSKIHMWRGVVVAYIIVALCYFPVAFLGYWAFGNLVNENILISLRRPTWLIAMANLMVVLHVSGGYQVYAMPVYDMLETLYVMKLRRRPTFTLRLLSRSIYVAFTALVAASLPYFGDLLGFFGGFGLAPTTYFLPCIIWLLIYKPTKFSSSWFTNWVCIVIGVLLMLFSTIGGLRFIITKIQSHSYTFWN